MYSVDQRDKVIELKQVPQSSVGAPMPVVLSDEFKVLLVYIVQETPADVDPGTADEPLALVEFTGYRSYMFGGLNDEAFHGHPLATRGLYPYGAFQIENSSWIRQLEKMNSVHPSHNPGRFARLRHYVFSFHDSTFECVANGYIISMHEGSLESMLPIMQSRLQRKRL